MKALSFLPQHFDLKAFGWGSFYFVKYHKWGLWIGYLCLALLLAFGYVFITVDTNLFWSMILAGIATEHLIVGFAAPKHKALWQKEEAERNPSADVSYMVMSPARLAIMLVLSCNIYSCYWMYKNWRAVYNATKESIWCLVRAVIFPLFFIYPLMRRMDRAAEKYQQKKFLLRWIAIGIIFCWVAISFVSTVLSETALVVGLALWIVQIGLFMKAQQTVNRYQVAAFGKVVYKKAPTWGETVVVLVGLLLFVWPFAATDEYATQSNVATFLRELSPEQQKALGAVVGESYRNIYGYAVVCEEAGYKLQNYPDAFRQTFANELDELNQILAKHGVSLSQMFALLATPQAVSLQYEDIRLALTQAFVDAETSLADACQIFDENADEISATTQTVVLPQFRQNLKILEGN